MITITTKSACDRCGTYVEKETDSGMIPNDWRVLKLNDNVIHICDKCTQTFFTWVEREGMENADVFVGIPHPLI